MKKFLALSLLSSSLLFNIGKAKAEWDFWAYDASDRTNGLKLYTVDSATGNSTLRTTKCWIDATKGDCDTGVTKFLINKNSGNIIVKTNYSNGYQEYDLSSNSWSTTTNENWRDNYSGSTERLSILSTNSGEKKIEIKGDKVLTKKSDGAIHIGENSAVFKEENGREKFWAQDANGKSIPIDITNGSKLLINGRDVEQSINNVGALSAALTGLPRVPTDTNLTCGLGTGTHGGDFAFSGGCASKVNEKFSINYAASMTLPGQDYAGDFEDQFSARAGFVWKLGKSTKPTQISMQAKEQMEDKINSLEEKNNELLARLERLEKVALGESKSKDLATIKLP